MTDNPPCPVCNQWPAVLRKIEGYSKDWYCATCKTWFTNEEILYRRVSSHAAAERSHHIDPRQNLDRFLEASP